MTDWTQIGATLRIQNLCLYDKLNVPLQRDDSAWPCFSCCPYAGPIAIAQPAATPSAWTVSVLMQNGAQIAALNASGLNRIFWSKCQKLVLCCVNGRVLIYDPLGKLLNTFTMGDETLAVGLSDAKIFSYANETGLAVLNSARHIFVVNSINTPILWRIQDISREPLQPLSCWTAFSQAAKPTQVLLCSRTRLFIGQQDIAGLQACNFSWTRRDGQYLEMEPNHSCIQLLLLHDSKLVQIIDMEMDLQIELRQIRLAEQAEVGRIFWCTDSAIAIQNKSELGQLSVYSVEENDDEKLALQNGHREEAMKAPNFTFSFPTPVRISSDLDGIRVFTRQTATLLLPVPAPSKAVLGLGSNEPGALLYGAAVKLEQRSHVAYEFIRSISAEQMPVAVDHCLAAAAHHFDPNVQKLLLKAASMGMRRCGRPYDSDKFVRICRLLRVLNALRLMGTPLTYAQMEHLSTPSAIDRLVALGHWPMAIRLCEFLELEPRDGLYKVLAHWCMAMMVAHKERADGKVEALAQRIVAQLKPYSAIAFADIAEMAARQELPSLATTLLELETNVGRQVTVMLKLKQLEKALQRAAQSQQPDLMHLVLKHLRNSLSGREVELLLRKVPQALSIYQSEIRDEAPERLLALYEQNDDFARQAIHYLQRAEQSQDIFDVTKTTEQLAKAEKALRNMRDGTGAQLVAESAQLVVDNSKREEKFGTSMTHMSVRETFFWAAAHEELAMLEQLRKQHRLSEKQVFLWTIEGFARGGKWPQLEQYGRSRKSPVGYLPVVELCATHGNKNLATRFMDKLAGYEEQVRAYLALGEVKKAATLAVEKSDMQMLQLIRRRFPTTSPHWAEVSKMMENLSKTT